MFLGNCSLKFLLAANTVVRDELKIVTSHKLRLVNKLVTLTCIIHEDVLRKEVEFKQSFQLYFFYSSGPLKLNYSAYALFFHNL